MRFTRRSVPSAVVAGILAAMASSKVVPDKLFVTSKIKNHNWSETPLIPIDFSPVGVIERAAIPAQDVVMKHTGPSGSIAFVIRRPG